MTTCRGRRGSNETFPCPTGERRTVDAECLSGLTSAHESGHAGSVARFGRSNTGMTKPVPLGAVVGLLGIRHVAIGWSTDSRGR